MSSSASSASSASGSELSFPTTHRSLIRNDFFELITTGSHVLLSRENYLLCLFTSLRFITTFPTWTNMLWERQRPIEDANVKQILDYVEEKQGGLKLVNQVVTIATVLGDDPRIIDGQHRLRACLDMHQGTEFFVVVADYPTANDRFIEFIKINSNTPLPAMYKDIADVDGYYKMSAKYIAEAICTKYPDCTGSRTDDYCLHSKKVEEQLFDGLAKRHVPMSDIAEMCLRLLDEIESDVMFPRTSAIMYPTPSLKEGYCFAQQNATSDFVQCSSRGKPEHGGFCGTHKAQKHPFNPIHIRNKAFQLMQTRKRGFFLLDPRWIDKVLDKMFVMDMFD